MFPRDPNAIADWNEPALFAFHNFSRRGWIIRGIVFVSIYAIFLALMLLENHGAEGANFSLARLIALPAFVSAILLIMFELPNVQRRITITESELSYIGTLMLFGSPLHLITGMGRWAKVELAGVRILRQGHRENKFRHPLLLVYPKYGKVTILGVPESEDVEEVAESISSLGVDVELEGWSPPVECSEAEQ